MLLPSYLKITSAQAFPIKHPYDPSVKLEISKQINSKGENVCHLVIDDDIWMSNDDYEYSDIERSLATAHGDCFVAGYGMGLIVAELLELPNINSIIVVDVDQRVLELMCPMAGFESKNYGEYWQHIEHPKCRVFCGDARDKIVAETAYDWIYVDTYAEPTEEAYNEVLAIWKRLKPYSSDHCVFECWKKEDFNKKKFWK